MHEPASSATSFIGRRQELAEIRALLVDPTCRLVTLYGPGGVGKSRIAQEIATQQADAYTDGVFFVPLQGVESPHAIVSTVADVLQLALRGEDDLRSQLLDRLRRRNHLLILDNLEHLLAPPFLVETMAFIEGVLREAPAITLLITSREVLNLQGEWVFPLRGLPCPADTEQPAAATCESLLLFAERSRQIRTDFTLQDDLTGAVRICRLVDGLPLALELAASWTRVLPCSAIADEIERNLTFLASTQRNIPPRHQSIQAVFEHSWALLPHDERVALRRLSVFRSGFRREAALEIAGVRLATLAALADKSLLQPQPDGRYQIHELFRQFAESHLLASPQEVAYIRDAHCAYYCTFLSQRRDSSIGLDQLQAVQEIRAEMQNVRSAWRHALRLVNADLIQRAAYTLLNIFEFQGRYRESRDQFQQAIDALDRPASGQREQSVLAELLTYQGMCHLRLGQLDMARAALQRSLALYGHLDVIHPPGLGSDPRVGLSIVACIEGDFAEAARLGVDALQIADSGGDLDNAALACYALANACVGQGDYDTAKAYAERAYLIARSRSTWFTAYCLNVLGEIAVAQAEYAEAISCFQASDAIRRQLDDLEGMAVARRHLADIAALQEDYEHARDLYSQAVAIYEEIDDRGGLATALEGLIRSEHALHDTADELEHCRQALRVVARTQLTALKLSIIADIGLLLLDTQWQPGAITAQEFEQPMASPPITYRARGVELLALVRSRPESEPALRERVDSILERCANASGSEQLPGARPPEAADLDEIIAALRAELATLAAGALIGRRVIDVDAERPEQDLVEPLTPRELEIVELLADGLSNQAVAEHLALSLGTVKWYTSQIYGKLGVRSRTQAIARSRGLRLIA